MSGNFVLEVAGGLVAVIVAAVVCWGGIWIGCRRAARRRDALKDTPWHL